jgi:hypothetical protein
VLFESDVVVSDNLHPARSGSAALYTVEHFEGAGALRCLERSRTSKALARSDVSSARALLGELTRVQPARSEAARLLAALSSQR